METAKYLREKNEHMCQGTHAQNHVYINKNRHLDICDVCQLSNSGTFIFMEDFVTFQRHFEAVSWEKLNDFITFGHFF